MPIILKMFIDNEELKTKYKYEIEQHNSQIQNRFYNAGFDLFCPEKLSLENNKIEVNTKIVCAMYNNDNPIAFYLYPRSSVSKLDLSLANSVGIIDNNYRGLLIAKFNNFNIQKDKFIEKYSRLLQICSPTLECFKIILVDNINEFEITERGSGGFGSTGI
jgi:dUTP pyrophosphatase